MAQSLGRKGAAIVAALIVAVAVLAALHYNTKRREAQESITVLKPGATPVSASPAPGASAAPKAFATPTPDTLTVLGPLSAKDMPPSVTLLKPEEIKYKKGGIFTPKPGSPLFFMGQYVRDSKSGEHFQILDYNPVERKVFLKAQAQNGQIVALNTLDLHGKCDQVETLPANSSVPLQTVADGNVVLNYQGDKFAVPVDETDFADQVRKRREGGM